MKKKKKTTLERSCGSNSPRKIKFSGPRPPALTRRLRPQSVSPPASLCNLDLGFCCVYTTFSISDWQPPPGMRVKQFQANLQSKISLRLPCVLLRCATTCCLLVVAVVVFSSIAAVVACIQLQSENQPRCSKGRLMVTELSVTWHDKPLWLFCLF